MITSTQFKTILIPVDNSEHSNFAIDMGNYKILEIIKSFTTENTEKDKKIKTLKDTDKL